MSERTNEQENEQASERTNEERDFMAVSQATAIKETEAYNLFCERFDRENPKPPTPTVTMMNEIGWQFISIVTQSIFAIILAALRTADMFFDAAAGTNTIVQYIEAIAAIGAIELGVVIYSTIKSEAENARTELEDLKAAMKIDRRLLQTGIIACVAISIIAGLGVSFKGFGIELWWMKWLVAIVLAIGASLVAWVSGDILGAILARWKNASSLAQLQYQQKLDEREAKKRQSWEGAPERNIARSELMELKEYLASTRYKAPRAPRQTPAPAPQQPQPRRTSTRSNEIRMKIYSYLDTDWEQHGDVTLLPGPTKLMADLGVAKGYASDVIKAWKVERNIPTPESENAPQ
jgi:hypothetical protein